MVPAPDAAMRARDTLLGLLVVALVAGGVYWARVRPSPAAGASSGHTAPAPSAVGEQARDDAATPDVTTADASVDLDHGSRLTLSISPRPPVAFSKKRFRVRVASNDGVPVALAGGRISFEMAMPMGDHRYTLVTSADGWQEAEVVLPFCKSGNPRWYAIVEGTVAGRPILARFRLDLTKPGVAPAS